MESNRRFVSFFLFSLLVSVFVVAEDSVQFDSAEAESAQTIAFEEHDAESQADAADSAAASVMDEEKAILEQEEKGEKVDESAFEELDEVSDEEKEEEEEDKLEEELEEKDEEEEASRDFEEGMEDKASDELQQEEANESEVDEKLEEAAEDADKEGEISQITINNIEEMNYEEVPEVEEMKLFLDKQEQPQNVISRVEDTEKKKVEEQPISINFADNMFVVHVKTEDVSTFGEEATEDA
eukprot:TRINITY_DN277_c0_g1_i1.p1 TRINITY_DN277_c0_g1~~TRINITY_DN277_c0_g1_i1.p1  ORF type:complete len:254 (+),score=116.87 TRINITY_DN277_c0_g1_i1:44-763(+)